jgi:hypothetical protein
MSTTRSGIIYSNRPQSIVSATEEHIVERRRSPRNPLSEPTVNGRSKRSTSNRIPLDILREYMNDSDDDNSSDYEEEEEYQYLSPKYDVSIDFDESSVAWRSNKLREGERWVYRLNMKHPENLRIEIANDIAAKSLSSSVAPKSVASNVAPSVASNVAPSVASRVKQYRRTANAYI